MAIFRHLQGGPLLTARIDKDATIFAAHGSPASLHSDPGRSKLYGNAGIEAIVAVTSLFHPRRCCCRMTLGSSMSSSAGPVACMLWHVSSLGSLEQLLNRRSWVRRRQARNPVSPSESGVTWLISIHVDYCRSFRSITATTLARLFSRVGIQHALVVMQTWRGAMSPAFDSGPVMRNRSHNSRQLGLGLPGIRFAASAYIKPCLTTQSIRTGARHFAPVSVLHVVGCVEVPSPCPSGQGTIMHGRGLRRRSLKSS